MEKKENLKQGFWLLQTNDNGLFLGTEQTKTKSCQYERKGVTKEKEQDEAERNERHFYNFREIIFCIVVCESLSQ